MLNQKTVLEWSIVNGNRFQRDRNYNPHFFTHVSGLISVMTGELSRHIAASYILFKKNIFGVFIIKIG